MNNEEIKILIAEDDEDIRIYLVQLITALKNVKVEEASDGKMALEAFRMSKHHLIISDLKMPEMSGLELLKKVKSINADTVFLMITAFGTVDGAVDAMKEGAFDYLIKPIKGDEIILRVRKAIEKIRLSGEVHALRNTISLLRKPPIIFKCSSMDNIIALCNKYAAGMGTVLIQGESGTGKELIARYIHDKSNRGSKPFIAINCAAIPDELLESELFGSEKGSFTSSIAKNLGKLELADKGTFFLDEIGEMKGTLQAKLLRVLKEKEFWRLGGSKPIQIDVRFISATNKPLETAVMQEQFREDLYYRLNVLPLKLPPLREREEDIKPLIEHFLQYSSRESIPFIVRVSSGNR